MLRGLSGLICAVLLSLPTSAFALTYTVRNDVVTAYDGERVVWTNSYNQWATEKKKPGEGGVVGPVLVGDVLFYGAGISLYRVDPADGVVKSRIILPFPAAAIEPDGDGVRVKIEGHPENGPAWERSYHVGAMTNEVRYVLTSDVFGLSARWDAQTILRSILPKEIVETVIKDQVASERFPEISPYLLPAVELLKAAEKRDPTNPWLPFIRGEFLRRMYRTGDAADAYRAALSLDRAYDLDLLGMVHKLDDVDPDLADEAFNRALDFMVSHDCEFYQPSFLAFRIYYGSPHDAENNLLNLKASGASLEKMNRLGERLWKLAPVLATAVYFFNALAEENRKAGNSAYADIWQKRMEEARPYRMRAVPVPFINWNSSTMCLVIACFNAIFWGYFVKLLRVSTSMSVIMKAGKKGMIPRQPAWLPRNETFGLVLVCIAGLTFYYFGLKSLVCMDIIDKQPLGAWSYGLGHPEGTDYWKKFAINPSGEFIYALALQQEKRTAEAEQIYRRLDDPRAKNNLGVIEEEQGNSKQAIRLWNDALAVDPNLAEAAFNLGRPSDDLRIEHARTVGRRAPLNALPAGAQWDEAVKAQAKKSDNKPIWILVVSAATWSFAIPLMLVLCEIYYSIKCKVINCGTYRGKASITAWFLGFLVPGSDRRYGFLGPLLLIIPCASLITLYYYSKTKDTILDPFMAVPGRAVTGYFGMASPFPITEGYVGPGFIYVWIYILIANFVILAVWEYFQPEPTGPFGKPTPIEIMPTEKTEPPPEEAAK